MCPNRSAWAPEVLGATRVGRHKSWTPQELDAVRPGQKRAPSGEQTMTYRAPVADISFALKTAMAEGLYGDLADDVVEAVLGEAGKFASDILSPLNPIRDRDGTRFQDG